MQTDKKHSPAGTKPGGRSRRTGARSPWLVFSGAALVALVLYLPTLRYSFVWDDRMLVLDNPFLNRMNPIELFTKGFWNNPEAERTPDVMSYYRPLTNLSLYVDRKVWGLQPTGYHLTNVMINTAAVFLMCLLLWELFGSVGLAGLGGLLVGIHPAMNCVVAFISNRTYLLALFFLLVSAYALARGQRGRERVWPLLFGGSLLLSTLALEASLVFAVLAAAWVLANRARYRKLVNLTQGIDRLRHPHPSLPLKGEGIEGRGSSGTLLVRKSVTVWLAAVAAPMAVYFLLRLGIARVPLTAAGSVMHSATTEPLRVINAFGQQLQLLLFPFNQKVIYVPTESFTSFSAYTILGLLFLGLPLFAVIRLGRSAGHQDTGSASSSPKHSARPEPDAIRLGWYGYAWMVLFLLPFAHLVFLGPAGRMLYLSAPGVLILLAALYRTSNNKRVLSFAQVDHLGHPHPSLPLKGEGIEGRGSGVALPIRRSETTRVVYGALLLYTAVVAVQTLRRNPIWSNELSLTQTMVREAPASAIGHASYGLILSSAGRKAEATEQFRIAVEIDPNFVEPRIGLAYALMDQEDLPGAIRELREVVRLRPDLPKPRNDLAVTLMRTGQLESAIAEYKEALRLDPNSGVTLNNLGYAYLESGDLGQAISFLKAALRLEPGFAGARRNLADAYRKAGMPDSAAMVEGGK